MKAALCLAALAVAASASSLAARSSNITAPGVTPDTMTMIERLEGFRDRAYNIDGHDIIGFKYNCTLRGDCDGLQTPISWHLGVEMLRSDLEEYQQCVCAMPNADSLSINHFGALISFTFDVGCDATERHFGDIMDARNHSQICKLLPDTENDSNMMDSRRHREAFFCNLPTPFLSGCNGTFIAWSEEINGTKPEVTKPNSTSTVIPDSDSTKPPVPPRLW